MRPVVPVAAQEDLIDAFSTSMIPLSTVTYPFRVCVRAVRGVRPEITTVRLEHGEEVVSVVPLEAPSRMNVKVRWVHWLCSRVPSHVPLA